MTNEILMSLSDINNNTNNNINAGLDHNSGLTIAVFEARVLIFISTAVYNC